MNKGDKHVKVHISEYPCQTSITDGIFDTLIELLPLKCVIYEYLSQ